MGKLYYWAEDLDDYSSDNELPEYDKIIEIKRLNFFIGKNNSGKSRFLRKLFIDKNDIRDYSVTYDFNPSELVQRTNDIEGNNYTYILPEPLNSNMENHAQLKFVRQQILELATPFFLIGAHERKIREILNNLLDFSYTADHLRYFEKLFNNSDLQEIFDFFGLNKDGDQNIIRYKFYIPTLRGMRPTTPIQEKNSNQDSNPYSNRTIFDYFSYIKEIENEVERKIEIEKIITGENLYKILSQLLFGEPEDRLKVRLFEKKLSEYFFDGEKITLIPRHGKDVIHIQIGKDKQLPIYELADGLQQLIILTFNAYIYRRDNDVKVDMFFIEEPELHMHPGMLRQLMNFYLNETPHYYFFTTHSNHLLDMVDESDEVIIQKFTKKPDGKFQINHCDKDRDLLAALGVKPSSVYLANCTIWVEGITDRLYIAKYMQKYLEELEANDTDFYIKYLRFMPNYHYAFVEYAGGNIAYWSFDEVATDQEEDRGLSAKCIASDMLLIVDGDNDGKADRVKTLVRELGDKSFHIFECKEIENTLPANIIIATAKDKFSRMKADTTDGFDISLLDTNVTQPDFNHVTDGIGRILDDAIWPAGSARTKSCFGESSGTIKDKLGFCRLALSKMEQESWELTPSAKALCEKIFQHIERCNQQ